MIRYLYEDELKTATLLKETMFLDCVDQFKTRLGWDVTLEDNGYERDEYDSHNPLYVIYQKRMVRRVARCGYCPARDLQW